MEQYIISYWISRYWGRISLLR